MKWKYVMIVVVVVVHNHHDSVDSRQFDECV